MGSTSPDLTTLIREYACRNYVLLCDIAVSLLSDLRFVKHNSCPGKRYGGNKGNDITPRCLASHLQPRHVIFHLHPLIIEMEKVSFGQSLKPYFIHLNILGSSGLTRSIKTAMARPTTRRNRFFWELIVAFMLVVSAAVFHTFHFFNNAWLVQVNGSYVYQRGLGDDCVKNEFWDGIRCTGWSDSGYSTFIINGQNITASDVVPPSIGLRLARVLMIFSILLYLVIIFSLFFTCVKRDLKVQKLLCSVTVLLVFISSLIIFLVLVDSSEPFIKTMKYCSLGGAFYYFLLSYLLLWIGSAVHFDSWIDVYDGVHTNDLPMRLLGHIRRNTTS
ncbi:unnamed protein product [Cercopithifilaria johnstoni]|uniref:Uncharacterized protein n=1 Tax=Cercopithifilaria johnstoni TaxID=2874296 RepID=A0A8J2QBC3_9BILA|nr:unnamed protein product [Cercopithifilaria johnstoni]